MSTTKTATKKSETTQTPKIRKQRTPEQMVADLEAEIARVKERAAAKEAKAKPEVKPFMAAVKAVDKALAAAKDAEADGVCHALETARATLGEQLIAMGVRAPVTRERKKSEKAA